MLKQTPYIAAGGRDLIALIFLISGFGKITAPTMTMGYINAVRLPFLMVAHIISIIIEIGGGILLIIGSQAHRCGGYCYFFRRRLLSDPLRSCTLDYRAYLAMKRGQLPCRTPRPSCLLLTTTPRCGNRWNR
jgi:hypothetical protein